MDKSTEPRQHPAKAQIEFSWHCPTGFLWELTLHPPTGLTILYRDGELAQHWEDVPEMVQGMPDCLKPFLSAIAATLAAAA